MFGKKTNKKEEIKNEFGDKNYKMKDEYNADELVVAKFQRVYIGECGSMVETTDQKYIFEVIKGEKIRYREIFTGFITDDFEDTVENGINFKYFNLPYACEPEKFTDYFPEIKGKKIPKLSLIWAQNDINFMRENINKKPKEKNKI